MTLRVVFSECAWHDLDEIYDWIADKADAGTAIAYLNRIEEFCSVLGDFPNRGSPRDDLAPGVRTTVFEGSAIVANVVGKSEVTIVRILGRGRDVTRAFPD